MITLHATIATKSHPVILLLYLRHYFNKSSSTKKKLMDMYLKLKFKVKNGSSHTEGKK